MRRLLESRWSYWPAFVLVLALAFAQTFANDRESFEELGGNARIATYAAALLGFGHGWVRDRYWGSILCVAGAFGAARIPLWLAFEVGF